MDDSKILEFRRSRGITIIPFDPKRTKHGNTHAKVRPELVGIYGKHLFCEGLKYAPSRRGSFPERNQDGLIRRQKSQKASWTKTQRESQAKGIQYIEISQRLRKGEIGIGMGLLGEILTGTND